MYTYNHLLRQSLENVVILEAHFACQTDVSYTAQRICYHSQTAQTSDYTTEMKKKYSNKD